MSQTDKRAVHALHALLIKRFPEAFPKDYDAIRPLKLGIHADLIARAPDLDPVLLRRALANHASRDGYLLALIHGRGDRRYDLDGHPVGTNNPIFTNTAGDPVHPESIYQLFHRQVLRLNMPCICFHGLRHTHASLLVAAGTPIKVVSERLGHANPGFTMATYQHVMPGMGAEAADKFSQLLAASR